MNYPKIIGGYYRVLGWLGLATFLLSIIRMFWAKDFNLDFTFIVWLLLGRGLQRANPTARKWAIGLSLFITTGIAILMIVARGKANFGPLEFDPSSAWYYVIATALLLLLGLPGLLLLSRTAKAQFQRPTDGEPLPTTPQPPATPAGGA